MGLVLRVAKHCRAPIAPHFMDDWPTTYYRGCLNAVPRWIMLSRLLSVMRGSPIGMSICPAMANEYAQRYGIRFQSFMNCVDVSSECPTGSLSGPNRPLKFVYLGGLHLNRWQSLQAIGQALLALREEGSSAELVIHAPIGHIAQFAKALAAITTIRVGRSLAQDQIIPAMWDADVLVHVESFDPEVLDYTRLSLSTKIPQYMASGRAILAYGPPVLASCRYIQDSQCGVIVGEQNAALLLKAVRRLTKDSEGRALLGRRGWEVARQRHEVATVRESFRSVLAAAASSVNPVTGGMPNLVARAGSSPRTTPSSR